MNLLSQRMEWDISSTLLAYVGRLNLVLQGLIEQPLHVRVGIVRLAHVADILPRAVGVR